MMPARPFAAAVSGLTTLLLAATFVAPASAAAATTSWSGEQPASNSSVSADPRAASVNASSTAALSSASARMTIDGIEYTCFVTNPPSASGHWQYTDEWDDETEQWVTSRAWVQDPDLTKARLLTYAWGGPLGRDGEHTAVASIKDADGTVVSDTWTFSVRIPPKIGSPIPASGSTVSTSSPTISVPVSDNGEVASWDAAVNGEAVSASLSGGVLHIATTSLRDGDNTVAVTVRDSVGATASLAWSFSVQTASQMPNMRDACLACHPGRDRDPDMAPECADCHNGVIDTPHQGDPAGFHVQADGSCSPCHLHSLPTEHARRTDATGNPLTCMTCHMSADQAVVSAIAAHESTCAGCHSDAGTAHDDVGSPTKHTPANPAITCLASGCHPTTNVAQLHSGAPGGSCPVCHAPGKAASTDCRSCHPAGSGPPTATSLAGTSVYHHDNAKYLNDSTDATASPYYWMGVGDPPHGWNRTLFLEDCRVCHRMHYQ